MNIEIDGMTEEEAVGVTIDFAAAYIASLSSTGLKALAAHLIDLAVERALEEEREAIRQEITHTNAISKHRYTKREALAVVTLRDLVAHAENEVAE